MKVLETLWPSEDGSAEYACHTHTNSAPDVISPWTPCGVGYVTRRVAVSAIPTKTIRERGAVADQSIRDKGADVLFALPRHLLSQK